MKGREGTASSPPDAAAGAAMLVGSPRRERRPSPESSAREHTQRGELHGIVLGGSHTWGNRPLERLGSWLLLPIASRPLIRHMLDWFYCGGVFSTSICANSNSSALCRTLEDGHSFGMMLDYYEDVMPRGPAGCVRDVMIASSANTFLVIDGSVVPHFSLDVLVATHEQSGAMLTVVATPTGHHGKVTLEPTGIYVFSREALPHIPSMGYQDIKEGLIPKLHAMGYPVAPYMVEPGGPPRIRCEKSYLDAHRWLAACACRDGCPADSYRSVGEARVHQLAQVDPSARLVGPVVVEEGCVIGADAALVGPMTIGDHCVIGRGAAVSCSALWSNCRVGAGAIVDGSILMHGADVSDGEVLRHEVRPRHAHHEPVLRGGVKHALAGLMAAEQTLPKVRHCAGPVAGTGGCT